MKILNLYAGIGGNRKLWKGHEVTAVEHNQSIADIYKKNFPHDAVIVGDAHQYLLDHYKEFDFIWSSPPCPSHSDIRRCGVHAGRYDALYPDMALYQEIILLKHFAKCDWVIENVKPYYKYLIEPSFNLGRHPFWSNLVIEEKKFDKKHTISKDIIGSVTVYGFNIKDEEVKDFKGGKRKALRNLVDPRIGEYILKGINGTHRPSK